jgi:hypothetical protein
MLNTRIYINTRMMFLPFRCWIQHSHVASESLLSFSQHTCTIFLSLLATVHLLTNYSTLELDNDLFARKCPITAASKLLPLFFDLVLPIVISKSHILVDGLKNGATNGRRTLGTELVNRFFKIPECLVFQFNASLGICSILPHTFLLLILNVS